MINRLTKVKFKLFNKKTMIWKGEGKESKLVNW
jgi:hypothetical protein